MWLQLDPGDCVLFDIRLLHTGHHSVSPKCAVFLAYGAPNIHSALHVRRYLSWPELNKIATDPVLKWRLAEAGLYLDEAAATDETHEAA